MQHFSRVQQKESSEAQYGRHSMVNEPVLNILTDRGVDFDIDVDELSKEMFAAFQVRGLLR